MRADIRDSAALRHTRAWQHSGGDICEETVPGNCTPRFFLKGVKERVQIFVLIYHKITMLT